ncbi:alpha/beta fold hydrolase [Frankia sp. CiP3]|uniref:alpha/beta fold hydrolase n=1 Tax=Frankia sp. CiP3 TaxID=2880971 RepID=UPI001EF524EB|nr:alpha/beta fold hydrolase [Frankia sp. CiP3]
MTSNTAETRSTDLVAESDRPRVVDLPGGSISYRLRGEGPLLVLVTTLSGTWMRQIPTLRKYFTVLTYDMRGFGDSVSTTGFPTNEEHADDLALLLDALGFPAGTVLGLSHGGLVSQWFAVRHPDRLTGLALVATFATPSDSTGQFLTMLYGFLERDDIGNFWEVLKTFLFSAANWTALTRWESGLRRAMFDQYTTASLRSIYGGALAHTSPAGLERISCPTLVVGGEKDMLFPPERTRELAERIPAAKMALLPAAHVPPVEIPKIFNDLVTDFFGGTR